MAGIITNIIIALVFVTAAGIAVSALVGYMARENAIDAKIDYWEGIVAIR